MQEDSSEDIPLGEIYAQQEKQKQQQKQKPVFFFFFFFFLLFLLFSFLFPLFFLTLCVAHLVPEGAASRRSGCELFFLLFFFFFFANRKKIYCLIIAIGEPSRRSQLLLVRVLCHSIIQIPTNILHAADLQINPNLSFVDLWFFLSH